MSVYSILPFSHLWFEDRDALCWSYRGLQTPDEGLSDERGEEFPSSVKERVTG